MQVNSKYMQNFVEAEESRIQREIALAVYQAFRRAGLRVSVSHDSQNKTEKATNAAKDFLTAVFDSDYDSDRCWVFAAKNGMASPFWVLLVLDNVEDIISDYGMSCEKIIARANETADKYQ